MRRLGIAPGEHIRGQHIQRRHSRRHRASGLVVLFLALVLVLLAVSGGCAPTETPSVEEPRAAKPLLVDRAADAGLDFVHVAGRAGAYRMPEIHGAGVGLFDMDGDGDLDVFLPQGQSEPPDPARTDRLYRNDGSQQTDGPQQTDGDVVPRFVDVTASAGVGSAGYSTGVAAADYDNDGDVDLYVTAFGRDRLWRNRGDGTFDDATAAAGLGDDAWSVGASWLDVDRDGRLDLYVVRYLEMPPGAPRICPTPSGEPDYCGPSTYQPLTDRLYRNRGDGAFDDVSIEQGIAARPGAGLGVVSLDVDADGWLDLFVANDKMANFLWLNRGGTGFDERAVELGAAVNEDGVAEAGMGVDAADFDADGDEDVAIAHLAGETHTLYRNGGGWFVDDGRRAGLAASSRAMTGFGLAWLDVDNDGHLDLASVHGHVHRLPALAEAGDPFPYHQGDGLWLGDGAGRLIPAGARAGALTTRRRVSRGLAVGDVDNDGDPDLVVTAVDAPVALWLDPVGQDAAWLGVRLVTAGRDALGALAVLETPDGPRQARVRTDGSYGSSRDPRLLFGLGRPERDAPSARGAQTLDVRWLSGRRERFAGLAPGRYHTLAEGAGAALEAPTPGGASP